LSLALGRARRDYKNNSNVYAVSAFDEHFDTELRKLVLHYSFDFEAIALHLCTPPITKISSSPSTPSE
jgi:hypothetical protein